MGRGSGRGYGLRGGGCGVGGRGRVRVLDFHCVGWHVWWGAVCGFPSPWSALSSDFWPAANRSLCMPSLQLVTTGPTQSSRPSSCGGASRHMMPPHSFKPVHIHMSRSCKYGAYPSSPHTFKRCDYGCPLPCMHALLEMAVNQAESSLLEMVQHLPLALLCWGCGLSKVFLGTGMLSGTALAEL